MGIRVRLPTRRATVCGSLRHSIGCSDDYTGCDGYDDADIDSHYKPFDNPNDISGSHGHAHAKLHSGEIAKLECCKQIWHLPCSFAISRLSGKRQGMAFDRVLINAVTGP